MHIRTWLASLCAVALLTVSVQAQQGRPGGGTLNLLTQTQPLLTKDLEEKLKLDDKQKTTVAKLDKEFADKQTEAIKPIKETVEKLLKDRDPQAMREAGPQIREVQTKISDLKKDYQGKVKDILTDEQKKIFDEVAQRPGPGGGFQRPGQPGQGGFQRPGQPGQGQPGQGGFQRGGSKPGQVLTDGTAEQLKLTEDQKKKLAEIQKKVDDELNKLLTDEQKKQFEDMKNATPGRRPRTDMN